jgi:hypothetical protein
MWRLLIPHRCGRAVVEQVTGFRFARRLRQCNLSGSDELNYQGVAEITSQQGFLTNLFARLAGGTLKDGKLRFPFYIGGTIDNPVFAKGLKGEKVKQK